MTLAKSENDWAILINEYSVCKKKLQSKRDALKILMKDLDQCQVERDIYKNKICQLQQELDELKDILGGYWRGKRQNGSVFSQEDDHNKKIKVLKQLLEHVREENQALHNDLKSVRQLYLESQNDNQLLRESISRHESHQKENNIKTQDKARLIEQLEEAQSKIDSLQKELLALNDERNEQQQERDYFKEKANRLNTELNYVLYNDERRIVDVDALVLENKYLKEVTKQYKEEKLLAVASSMRYKEALEQKKEKTSKFFSSLDLANSPKSGDRKVGSPVKSHRIRLGSNSDTVTELQRVAKSLTEMLSEKEIALKHQRNTNRILGTRVKELEKKLKTLEISGLWSLQGQGALKDRRISLLLEELKQKESTESDDQPKKQLSQDSDGDKSLTLDGSSEDDCNENNNFVEVREEILLDISHSQDTQDEKHLSQAMPALPSAADENDQDPSCTDLETEVDQSLHEAQPLEAEKES